MESVIASSESRVEAAADQESPLVVKLGGSLLDLPDLAQRLQHCLQTLQASTVVLVVGGGATADRVRSWQQQFSLTDSAAHDLAIHAMHLNAQCIHQLLPESKWLDSTRTQLWSRPNAGQARDENSAGQLYLANVPALLTEFEPRFGPLDRSWDATSDSIAAYLADGLQIHRLLLLKSADAGEDSAIVDEAASQDKCVQQMQSQGLVDVAFQTYAARLSELLWCNLRRATPQVRTLWNRSADDGY